MRGKQKGEPKKEHYHGITPADAGKTSFIFFGVCFLRDHPRGCGENGLPFEHLEFQSGSPPRMRGKRMTDEEIQEAVGITPADAGKTTMNQGQWYLS